MIGDLWRSIFPRLPSVVILRQLADRIERILHLYDRSYDVVEQIYEMVDARERILAIIMLRAYYEEMECVLEEVEGRRMQHESELIEINNVLQKLEGEFSEDISHESGKSP